VYTGEPLDSSLPQWPVLVRLAYQTSLRYSLSFLPRLVLGSFKEALECSPRNKCVAETITGLAEKPKL